MPTLNEERRALNDEFNLIVGCNIRHHRQRFDMTMKELAEAAGMDITTLLRVERGERPIKFREAACVARHLGLSIERLAKKQRGIIYEW